MDEVWACCSSLTQYLAWITLVCNLVIKPCLAITPAHLPSMFLSENCDHLDLQGMRKVLIHTQREQHYSSNMDCTLLLSVRGGYVMRFSFEHLDLPEPNNIGCEDSVQFHNGYNKELLLTRPFCGSKPPHPFVSNSSQVTLTFRTNSKNQRSGFRVKAERIRQTQLERSGCTRQQTSDCSTTQLQSPLEVDSTVPEDSQFHLSVFTWPLVFGVLVLIWALVTYSFIRR